MGPIFGNRNDKIEYRCRPGVYALIFNAQGRFAAVKGRTKFFLPGGGVEAGESPEETLMREVREECAREVLIGRYLGRAVQYATGPNEISWEFHCAYYEAQFGAALDNEPEHELHWLDVADAPNLLAYEVHAWAVKEAARQPQERLHG